MVEAPSIGRKTAKALARAGITTIGDLLDCDPDMVELELNVRHITSEALRTWQAQTQLMMDVPGLRVHDAQLLVGAGITTREDLANASARTIFELTMEFLSTPEGERVLRDKCVAQIRNGIDITGSQTYRRSIQRYRSGDIALNRRRIQGNSITDRRRGKIVQRFDGEIPAR